jgi:hypothetical protein
MSFASLPVRKTLSVLVAVYPPIAILIAAILMAGGCATRTEPAIRTTAQLTEEVPQAQLAAGELEGPARPVAAEARPAYPADLPVIGHAAARAVALHGKNRVDLINLGSIDWPEGGRLWVNGRYSAELLPLESGTIYHVPFEALVDAEGSSFPLSSRIERVKTVEVELYGELTNIRFALGY